jgi:PAS domain S-box-containing protein
MSVPGVSPGGHRFSSGPWEQRVLVLAPTGNDALLTQKLLTDGGFVCEIVPTISALWAKIVEGCGTLLLAEETLAAETVQPLLEAIALQPPWSDIPLVLITSGGETSQTRLRRLTTLGPVGNVTMLERPFRPVTLLSAIETALRARNKQYQVRHLLAVGERRRLVLQLIAEDAPLQKIFNALATMVELEAQFDAVVCILLAETSELSANALDGRSPPRFASTDGDAPATGGALTEASERAARRGLSGQQTIPILSGQGKRLGTLLLFHSAARRLEKDDDSLIATAVSTAAVAIERKHAERAVRSSEAQLRLVTDHASVYLVQCDREHRYKFVNRAYAERFGREPQDLLGAHVRDFLGERGYEAVRPYMEAALEGRRVEFEREIPYDRLSPRWMHTVYIPEHAKDGSVVGFVGVINDVTSRKQSELELMRARDKALEASRAKDDFLAALSHELRTPLNPVLLIASEAASNTDLSPEIREDFDTIAKNATLEARLIDDLLDLTRITHGKMSLDKRVIDLHAVLADALETIGADLREKEQTLAVKLTADAHHIFGDPARIQQVFWNVLKNAVKFTPHGGSVKVESGHDETSGRCFVRIQDTGIGMTREEVARVFEAFAQGDHARRSGSHRFGGLGLGLAISQMLVNLHGGAITATSEGKDKGSVFTIEFPEVIEEPVADEPAGAPGDAMDGSRAAAANDPHGRILVVEDHPATRVSLTRLLTRRGYEVVCAGSVAEALERASEKTYDLVVSDIGLPDGDGYSLMTRLRDGYDLSGIALSGYGMEQDIARGRAAGFTEHLIKPVSVQALDRALQTWEASRVAELGAAAAAAKAAAAKKGEPDKP